MTGTRTTGNNPKRNFWKKELDCAPTMRVSVSSSSGLRLSSSPMQHTGNPHTGDLGPHSHDKNISRRSKFNGNRVIHALERKFTRRIRRPRLRRKSDDTLTSMTPMSPPPPPLAVNPTVSRTSRTSSLSFTPSISDITPVTVIAPSEPIDTTGQLQKNAPRPPPILKRKGPIQWTRKSDQFRDGWEHVTVESNPRRTSYPGGLTRKPSTMDKLKAGLKRRAGKIANGAANSTKSTVRANSIKRLWPNRPPVSASSYVAPAPNSPMEISRGGIPASSNKTNEAFDSKVEVCGSLHDTASSCDSYGQTSSIYTIDHEVAAIVEQSLEYPMEQLSLHSSESIRNLSNGASVQSSDIGPVVQRVDSSGSSTTQTSSHSRIGDDTQLTDIAELCNQDSILLKEVRDDLLGQIPRLGSPIYFFRDFEDDIDPAEIAEANEVRYSVHSFRSESFTTANSEFSTSIHTNSNCTELTPLSVATQASSCELPNFASPSPLALQLPTKSLLKLIYHHETIREAMLTEQKSPSNQFWSILHCFVKDGETLYQVLEQLNNKVPLFQITAFLNSKQYYNECIFSDSQDCLVKPRSKSYDEEAHATTVAPQKQRRQSEGWKLQHERYKNDGDGWFYSCLLEEVRQLVIHETISIQPPLDDDATASKLACWHSTLVANLRLHDTQLWRYDAEKIWTIAMIYRAIANRSAIYDSKKQELEIMCLNHNSPDGSLLLSYDEFVAKLHGILTTGE